MFAILNFIILFPIYFFYVETSNRRLEDLDVLLSAPSPYFKAAERRYALHKEEARRQEDKPYTEYQEKAT